MITTDDLSWEDQKALQRQLNLCAKNLNKLVKMVEEIVGTEGNVYMDASTALFVMSGNADDECGGRNASGAERQKYILLESPNIYGRIGAGDW